jgi:imidazolonepropionase-like amidohydrolase
MTHQDITFRNVRLVNPGAETREGVGVRVAGGRIAAVGEVEPDGGRVVDGSGLTLLPGLIDCHLHVLGIDTYDFGHWALEDSTLHAARGVKDMERLVEAGFTTVRDAGSDISLALKKAQAQGAIRGPRMWASGRWISVTGNLPDLPDLPLCCMHERGMGIQADGPAGLRRAVREQVRGGADIIKIATTGGIDPSFLVTQASMADVELEAVIQTAHDLGRRVTAHNNVLPGQRPIGIERAVRAGIDAIDHGYYLDDDIIERMAEAQTWWIVTSSYLKIVGERGPEAGLSQIYVDKARAALESVFDSIPRARRAGVRIATGSDLLGTPVDPHGLNGMELVLLREAGFSDREVIDVVTGTNASMLGIEHFTGSIETGKSADLLLVAGRPDEDVSVLADPGQIRLVMVEGKVMKDELTQAVSVG